MTPELHLNAKQLFLEVCDLDEQARGEYLDAHCADDPELRAEVESLLRYHVSNTLLIAPQASGPLPPMNNGADRWLPGSMIAGRYRIVHALGKGGMGEVYRAEDTLLARPVALKFITSGRGTNPVWLSQFFTEARTASSITHRHVCRLYDIGEADGEAFISMEYIDGENLGVLLRRVGRLTVDKAAELARQLCFGLGAIHAGGILHRDLKPANIVIDGRGEVRITDFGIAAPSDLCASGALPRAGTPRYMAPELTRGEPATVSSDLYALGMILCEVVTGRNPFADSRAEEGSDPVPCRPSDWAPDLDGGFERVILACLEREPRDRPGSAYEVLAGVPGAETLSSITQAGEIPPVEIVARSSTHTRWDLMASRIGAFTAIAGLCAVLLLASRTLLFSHANLHKAPEVLAERARSLLREFGYDPGMGGTRSGFIIDHGGWERARAMTAEQAQAGQDPTAKLQLVGFRYALLNASEQPTLEPAFLDTPATATYAVQVVLDGQGHLRGLDCQGAPNAFPAQSDRGPQWPPLLAAAGLEPNGLREVTPRSTTLDGREKAWETVDGTTRIEATEAHEQVVRFRMAESAPADAAGAREAGNRLMIRSMCLITLFLTVPLAWMNLRRRLSDRRGAAKLAAFTFAAGSISHALRQVPPRTVDEGFAWVLSNLQAALFTAFLVWLYYIALEPQVRRFWPHSLISWARLLGGRFRDPLVGRDVVIGCALGVGMVLILQAGAWACLYSSHPWAGLVAPLLTGNMGRLTGYGFTLGTLADAGLHATTRALLALALMLFLRTLTGRRWTAGILFFLITFVSFLAQVRPLAVAEYAAWITLSAVMTLALDRAGFLTVVVGLFVSRLLVLTPLTLDMSHWYAGQSMLAVFLVVLLTAAGLYAGHLRPRVSPPAWL